MPAIVNAVIAIITAEGKLPTLNRFLVVWLDGVVFMIRYSLGLRIWSKERWGMKDSNVRQFEAMICFGSLNI